METSAVFRRVNICSICIHIQYINKDRQKVCIFQLFLMVFANVMNITKLFVTFEKTTSKYNLKWLFEQIYFDQLSKPHRLAIFATSICIADVVVVVVVAAAAIVSIQMGRDMGGSNRQSLTVRTSLADK